MRPALVFPEDQANQLLREAGEQDVTAGDAGVPLTVRDLVLARIIEPTSKADSLRVLAETGVNTVTYRTLTRHLPRFAEPDFGAALSKSCAAQAALGRRVRGQSSVTD